MLSMRVLQNYEFEKIKYFYQENDYSPVIDPTDIFLITEEEDEIRAALRLCRENGCLVLRGMRVSPKFYRMGIGSELLRFACEKIGNEVCYCIPHSYLRNFYGQISFEEISLGRAPNFLASRIQHYRREYCLDVILMRKPVSKP